MLTPKAGRIVARAGIGAALEVGDPAPRPTGVAFAARLALAAGRMHPEVGLRVAEAAGRGATSARRADRGVMTAASVGHVGTGPGIAGRRCSGPPSKWCSIPRMRFSRS